MDKSEGSISGSSCTRRYLMVLFIPSADRVGKALPDQDEWKKKALEFFGTNCGGATAMPRAEGVWRDDDNNGKLIYEHPILIHCYVTEEQVMDKKLQAKIGNFCNRLGKETKQGEVALIIDGVFHSFKDFG